MWIIRYTTVVTRAPSSTGSVLIVSECFPEVVVSSFSLYLFRRFLTKHGSPFSRNCWNDDVLRSIGKILEMVLHNGGSVARFDFFAVVDIDDTRTPPVEAALIPVTTPSQPQCKHAHLYRSASAPGWLTP